MKFAELRPILFAMAGALVFTSTAAASLMTPVTAAMAQDVTFTKDVAAILQRSCQNCHRPNSIAPMSLLTYEEVRPWAKAIKQNVVARNMPPWHVARGVGITRFKDDPSLTDQEIATIVKWVEAGAPKGNDADLPPPVQFKDDNAWPGTPDVVITSVKHQVPAWAPTGGATTSSKPP
jgi:mono/diheme cytochrome c family protein